MSSIGNSGQSELEAIRKLQLVNQFLDAILCGSSIAFNPTLIETLVNNKLTRQMSENNLRNQLSNFVRSKREAAQDYGEYRHIIEGDPYGEGEVSMCGTSMSFPQSLKFDFSFHREDWDPQAYSYSFE